MTAGAPARRARDERATGVFGTAFGFTVFLLFLLLTVQVLFGLYARTTVTAVAADLAQRAADAGGTLDESRRAAWAEEGRRRLGDYGDDAEVTLSLLDVDGDGVDDTVAVGVRARLPRLLPIRWAGSGPAEFSRTMRARIEQVQADPGGTP